jgi:hypothetical protein
MVPVNIDDPHPEGSTGLIEAHLALTYDARRFTVSAADVHLGSVLAAGGDWSVTPTINPVTGEIAIALSSTTSITDALGGSLVTIAFHQTGAASGAAAFELVASVSPSGQDVTTELEDAQGTFTLGPAPSNGFDPRIDGVVTLSGPALTQVSSMASSMSRPVVIQAEGAAPVNPALSERTEANPAAEAPQNSKQGMVEDERSLAETATSASGAGARTALVAVPANAAVTGTPLAAPLAGLVFQLAGTPIAPGAGAAVGQFFAEQVFQVLGRGTNSGDSNPTGAFTDIVNRILASQPVTSQAVADTGWNEGGADLGCQDFGTWPALEVRTAATKLPSSSTGVKEAETDYAALDQVFAKTADGLYSSIETD